MRNLCTKYSSNELQSIVDAQSIIEEGVLFIQGSSSFLISATKVKDKCAGHTRQYKEKVTHQEQQALQYKIMQQRTADTLGHALDAVFSLAAPLKTKREEVARVSQRPDEYRSKW